MSDEPIGRKALRLAERDSRADAARLVAAVPAMMLEARSRRTAATAGSPTLAIGGARIAFVTPKAGTTLAAALASGGEGMAMVCLEVASLDDAEASLRQAGIGFTADSTGGRRGIAIDPGAAHGVRLTLIAGAAR